MFYVSEADRKIVMKVSPVINEPKQISNRKKVTAASIAGSAIGIATGITGVYAMAKKGNPALGLKKLAYQEKDVLLIGASSVLGGLVGGLIADNDKENIKPKLREASQQFVGNTLFPVSFIALGNKLLEKTNFQLPKFKSTSKIATTANVVLAGLPRILTTAVALASGSLIGNKLMNTVNDKIYNEKVKHSVKPEDMLMHSDDICMATSLLFKNAPKISTITNTILPATFLVAGAKSGMQQKENC